ncbi:hypothetical protein [uncultured Pontibacter sp.]|uniref:hypothetical protein n=1 Tax=uncultured Pontibacter sp. TaxID=453356 RepID=UPI00263523FA|nr:hypothetical protein [uncultured Pontibacter sp.]
MQLGEGLPKLCRLYQKYSNRKPTMQEVLEAKIHGVSEEYVKEVHAMRYKDLSMKKVMEARIHGVNEEFIKQAKQKRYSFTSIDKYIALKIHGIAIKSLKE